MTGDVIATFIGLVFTAVVVIIFVSVFVKISKSAKESQHMEEYKRKKAAAEAAEIAASRKAEEERRRKATEMRSIARSFGIVEDDDKAKKHAAHVADSHAHGHAGEEEHYDEIVGSLGEVNDEGCADLNGVRFIANDIAYEIQTHEEVDYDRIAQAMVLGEIINSPRFKTPYTKRK